MNPLENNPYNVFLERMKIVKSVEDIIILLQDMSAKYPKNNDLGEVVRKFVN